MGTEEGTGVRGNRKAELAVGGLGSPFTTLMYFPSRELIHVTGRKESVSTSQCVQNRACHLPSQPCTPSCIAYFC